MVCFSALLIAAGAIVGGCTSADYLHDARSSLDRAFRFEPPTALLGPALARALGEPIPKVDVRARQYYLSVIANLEMLGPRGREELRRDGSLGDAFAAKAVAQWRLDRLKDARDSIAIINASHQDPFTPRDRALLKALQAVLELDAIYDAAAAGKGPDDLKPMVTRDGGVWSLLTEARAAIDPSDPLQAQFVQLRLAAFKVVFDARNARNLPAPAPGSPEAEAWSRFRSEAQVDFNDLGRLPSTDTGAGTTLIRRWQVLCGLDAASR